MNAAPMPISPRRPHRITTAAAVVLALLVGSLAFAASPASAAESVVTSDSFTRTASNGWGSSAYTASTSAPSALSTTGTTARIALSAGQSAYVKIPQAKGTDVRASAALKFAKITGNTYYAFALRTQSDGSAYRMRIQVDAAGTTNLVLTRFNGKTETRLATTKLTTKSTDGAWRTFTVTVTGTTKVRIEARFDSAASTAAPQFTYTDSSTSRVQKSGASAFWGYASASSSGTTDLRLDDLKIVSGSGTITSALPSTSPGTTTPTPSPSASAPSTGTTTPGTSTGTAAPTAKRGAVTVGSAKYTVPSGAIYVDDSATSNGAGTAKNPYRTVSAAVSAAKSGATIVVRAGTYHEEVRVPYNKKITVQAYPGETVWFDGSVPVTNWVASGKVWISSGWNAQFSSNMAGGQTSRFVDPAHPMAPYPDQLFIDGVQLTQVKSASEVVAGTFAVDYAGKRLILGTNPAGRAVRASDLEQAFRVESAGSTLQGFGVRRYATSYDTKGAIWMQNTSSTLRDVVVTENATFGIVVSNNDALIERVTATKNGMLGANINAAYRLVLRDSVFSDNNTEHFKSAPVAGGVKITRSRGVTVSNLEVARNDGHGLWIDESVYDAKVTGSDFTSNSGDGLLLELSEKVTVAGNTATKNDIGMVVFNAGNVRIYNNAIGENTKYAIRMWQDERRQATTTVGRDPRMGGVDATVPWVTKNITIANNLITAPGTAIFALDKKTNRDVDTWNLAITNNAFGSPSTRPAALVEWGNADNNTTEKLPSPTALATAKKSSTGNVQYLGATTISAVKAKAPATTATSLPSDIATLLGVSSSYRALGTP